MQQTYKKPPITEAVIEIRFKERIADDFLRKAHSRLKKNYALSMPYNHVQLQFNLENNSPIIRDPIIGYRLSNEDQTDILVLTPDRFIVLRLPLYTGWQEISARAKRDWTEFKRIISRVALDRIGVRYINRIDVPIAAGSGLNISEYVKFNPLVPNDVLPAMAGFTMQVVSVPDENECKTIINGTIAPSPLLNHTSLILDIDIVRDSQVPLKDDDIWVLIDKMRVSKNAVFEGCITDKSRSLFND